MATDSAAQRTSVYKQLHLKSVPVAGMHGDSIASRLANEVNLSNYYYRREAGHYLINVATGGASIAYRPANDPETWDPYSFYGRSVPESAQYLSVVNFDVLIVWAGFNDRGSDIPLGTVGTSDPNTFEGAMRAGVANYLAQNPSLQIMFVTPNSNPTTVNNTLGLNLVDYRNRMISVCSALNLPCYDLYSITPISAEDAPTILPDNVHPIQSWLELRAPEIAEFVIDNL